MQNTTERKDVYTRITGQIVEYLEKGVRPWVRPWNAEHAAGRIARPDSKLRKIFGCQLRTDFVWTVKTVRAVKNLDYGMAFINATGGDFIWADLLILRVLR